MAEAGGDRRRIDRVTAPELVADLGARTPAELRAMRDDCQREEAQLSYRRRVLQGKIDIARAEATRRGAGDAAGALLGSLPSILADSPTPGERPVRALPVYAPEDDEGQRSEDAIIGDATLGRLPDLADEELAEIIERLIAEERRLSDLRRVLLDNLDRVKDELVRRYRTGELPVDEILSSSRPGAIDGSANGALG